MDNCDTDILAANWLLSGGRTENHYYYHYDGLGSVIAISDQAGNTIEKYEYSVYGEVNIVAKQNGETRPVSIIGNPYYFTGRRLDSETGLYYYRARMYSASLGRFLQVDPIAYRDSMNLYVYVGNNPPNLTDPMGLRLGLHDAIFGGGGAVVGLAGQGVKDLWDWHYSGWAAYGIAGLSGAAAGEATLYGGPVAGGAAGAGVQSGLTRLRDWGEYKTDDFGLGGFAFDVGVGMAVGKVASYIPTPRISGVTAGRGSFDAVRQQTLTKYGQGMINSISATTLGKSITAEAMRNLPEEMINTSIDIFGDLVRDVK